MHGSSKLRSDGTKEDGFDSMVRADRQQELDRNRPVLSLDALDEYQEELAIYRELLSKAE